METGQLTESEIEDLVRRYPLPDGVEDFVFNREELAEALDTSLNTITAWINAGMPVQQVGGNGKPYELRLSHCFAWRQAQKAAEDLRSREARDRIAAMRLALVGGKPGDTLEALDPKQRREIYAAQIEQERLSAQRNQLLRRDDVRDLLEELFSMMRDTLEAAPDQVERIEGMPPRSVQAMIELCDGLVDELRGRIEHFWELKKVDTAKPRETLFDA